MRVTESDVSMLSAHVKDVQHFERKKLGVQGGNVLASGGAVRPSREVADQAQISDLGHLLADSEAPRAMATAEAVSAGERSYRSPQLEVMRLVLEKVMGAKVMLPDQNVVGSGVEYVTETLDLATEMSGFAASGLVRTADGREIEFDLTLERHGQHTDLNGSNRPAAGTSPMLGPLVLNSTDQVANLTGESFAFDLDADGRVESVSVLRDGSAFLALDRNGDGAINNGSELFGPSSGYAFSELAAHDVDANGWIDEADPVYARLRLWTPDRTGSGALYGLRETGVGAINLESRETPFDLHDESDVLTGAVHATGVYLAEDGTPGAIEQIDLLA